MSAPSVLLFGIEDKVRETIMRLLSGLVIEEAALDLDEIMKERDESIPLIIIGPTQGELSPLEVSQTLRSQFARAQIIMATSKSVAFSKKDLIKNGLNEVYYLPPDISPMEFDLQLFRSVMDQQGLTLVPVKAHDLMELDNLPIPTYIYLPSNGKYVPFTSGDDLTEAKKQKLKDFKVVSLHVEQKNLTSFYEAYAAAVKAAQSSDKMSETEKREILKTIVRDLISELFTEAVSGMNTGLRLNKHCKEITSAYLSASKNANGWHEKIQTIANGKEDFYAHSTSAMVASTLFAIGLGLDEKTVDALAVGALLHHIGFARLPENIHGKPINDLSAEELAIYKTHPHLSIEILKEKKVVLPELAYKIITQQCERYDGAGFPAGLKGQQVCQEAQLLHLTTILLEKISSATGGKTFPDVFEEFRQEYNNRPSYRPINPTLFGQLCDLFSATGRPVITEETAKNKPSSSFNF